jgi:hypothetical protein
VVNDSATTAASFRAQGGVRPRFLSGRSGSRHLGIVQGYGPHCPARTPQRAGLVLSNRKGVQRGIGLLRGSALTLRRGEAGPRFPSSCKSTTVAGSRGRSFVVKQLANARERPLDVRRVLLEVRLNSTQELGERSCIEPLYPVRVFTCFSLRPLERRFELTHASFQGFCRVSEQPLEKAEAPTEIGDDLATGLCEGHSLISSRVRLRLKHEVEIGEEGSDGGSSRGCRDHDRGCGCGCGCGGSNQRHRACCGRWRPRLRAPRSS